MPISAAASDDKFVTFASLIGSDAAAIIGSIHSERMAIVKRLLLPALLTLLCGAPVACYAQIVSMPEPLTANSPVPDAPSGKTPNGSSVSGKGGREALKAAMLDDIARKNLQFLDNPPGGIDMFKIDNGRKPESALFVHNVYLDG